MSNAIPYVLIPRSTLSFDKPIVFDLFVKVADRYVRVLKEGEIPNPERIDNYLSKKDDVLYIESASIERFMDARFADMFEVVSGQNPIEDRLKAFIRCTELCYFDLTLVRLHADKFMRLSLLSEAGFDFFKNQNIQKVLLRQMVDSIESPLSRRAVFGGALGLIFFLAQGDCTPLAFKSLFLGAVLRDLSVDLIDGKDPHNLDLSGNSEAFDQFVEHPQRSVKMLEEFKIVDDTVENLIMQHHEHPLGQGFPRGLKRVEIYRPAQYVFLADWVVNLMEACYEGKKLNRRHLMQEIHTKLPDEQRKNLPLLNKVVSSALGLPALQASA